MSQANLSLAADTDSGTTLVSKLLDWQEALHSCHRGASRPSYAAAGLIWVQVVSSTVENVYMFDGSNDTLLGVVNPTKNAFSVSSATTATTATKLATARGIRTNLGSESSVNFDGTAAIAPGVTGTLPITHGGTGATTASAALDNLGVTKAIAGITMDKWAAKVIGERFAIQTHLVGAETPPNVEGGPRFIKLTAGDAYNAGLLSGETVSGTAPLITATAVIALASSPLYGQTIHLANTERLFFRAGVSGVLQDDAFQGHVHAIHHSNSGGSLASFYGSGNSITYATDGRIREPISDGTNGTPRTAAETRPRNIAETHYMRIA